MQEDGHANGSDQGRQSGGLSQRTIGHKIQNDPKKGTNQNGQKKSRKEGEPKKRYHGIGQEGPQHVNLPMGEIDHLNHAVDHGVAHCYKGIDTAKGDPVYQLLEEQTGLFKEIFHKNPTSTLWDNWSKVFLVSDATCVKSQKKGQTNQ